MIGLVLVLLRVLKPFTPLIQKRVAGRLADYVNDRRQTRLKREQAMEKAATMDPEVLKELCAAQQMAEPPVEGGSSPWFLLSSGVLGAAVGAALCFIFVERKRSTTSA
jgi:hypothetical protein